MTKNGLWRSGFAAGYNCATIKHEALRSSCSALVAIAKQRHEQLTLLLHDIEHELHQLGTLDDAVIVKANEP